MSESHCTLYLDAVGSNDRSTLFGEALNRPCREFVPIAKTPRVGTDRGVDFFGLRQLPVPKVLILDVAQEIWRGFIGVEVVPGEHCARSLEIKMHAMALGGQMQSEAELSARMHLENNLGCQPPVEAAEVKAIVVASGSSRERVLKVTVYISDISLWGRFNKVYAEFFGDHRPARAVVPTRDLHFGFLVEIEAVAVVA